MSKRAPVGRKLDEKLKEQEERACSVQWKRKNIRKRSNYIITFLGIIMSAAVQSHHSTHNCYSHLTHTSPASCSLPSTPNTLTFLIVISAFLYTMQSTTINPFHRYSFRGGSVVQSSSNTCELLHSNPARSSVFQSLATFCRIKFLRYPPFS